MRALIRFSAAILLCAALAARAQEPPYSALYRVDVKGEPIGVAEVAVSLDGTGTYTVDTTFTADRKRGFLINMLSGARAAIVATLTESKLRADKISTGRGRKESTVEFDWEGGFAKSADGRRRFEVPLRGTDKNDRRDALAKTVFLATRWIPGNYAISGLEPGVEQEARPTEDTETPLGVYRATSLAVPLSSSWKLTLWSAAALNGLPVRLELGDAKGRAISFVLTALGDGSVESSRHGQDVR